MNSQYDEVADVNSCDCDEDNSCGCSYPNNMQGNACNCTPEHNCGCIKYDEATKQYYHDESVCTCNKK